MRRSILAGVLAVPLLLVPAQAHGWGGCASCGGCGAGGQGWGFGNCIRFGAGVRFTVCGHTLSVGNCCGPGCLTCLSPWYSYYPYEAYFNAPAPLGSYPYYPSPMVAPNTFGGGAGCATCGGFGAAGYAPPVMAGGYGYPPAGVTAAPAYWYGQ